MPNRIIKESICTSEDIAKLSPEAEILFYRLIVNADDYGRYFGNPSIVKSNCFPLKADAYTLSQVLAWLDELQSAGLLIRYEAEGRQYLQFCKWKKHQSVRAKNSKFPAPASGCKQMQADASNGEQMSPYSYSYSYSYNENECEESDRFEEFWDAFPNKSGDIRQAYFEYLGVIQSGVDEQELLDAVKWQKAEKETRYMGSAEKWLRNKGWTEQRPQKPQKQKGYTTAADYVAPFADSEVSTEELAALLDKI